MWKINFAQSSLFESYFAFQTYGCPLCLCVTLHLLESGQVAAAGGPRGPCQPHTVRQLTTEKGKDRKRAGRVQGGDTSDQKTERNEWKSEGHAEESCVRVWASSPRCHSFNRRLRPLLSPTGIAKRLVSLWYNGQLWMLSATAGYH